MSESSTHRSWVTVALLLAMFMTAIEITIVATAMPKIVSDLGGFSLLSWVFSAYLLTQVVSIPIYGKLADLYGRKPVILGGIAVFLVASVLCGQSTNMIQLIAFRFLQGIGGGAVQPIAVTIVGDLYRSHERHKVQGLIGSVFAISSLVGPTLGAIIVELGHWPWIFYLNVPLGILAILILWIFLKEENKHQPHKIDLAGAGLLVITTSLLMFALLEGGTVWDWLSWQSLSCFAGFIVLGLVLLKHEGKVKEPILPLWIFKNPLISIAGAATFLNGAMMIGYSAMIPTHVQGVLGESALVGGFVLASMSIGWPLASFGSGFVMKIIGYQKTAILGACALLLGAIGVYLFDQTSALIMGISVFIIGVGLGLQSNAYIITIQSSVSWRERGVATANNLFMRTLGSSVGVAAFGGVLNSTIANYLESSKVKISGGHGVDLVNHLLSPSGSLSEEGRNNIIRALADGMSAVFVTAVAVGVLCLIITFFLPPAAEEISDK